jgi:hypothetical protein
MSGTCDDGRVAGCRAKLELVLVGIDVMLGR